MRSTTQQQQTFLHLWAGCVRVQGRGCVRVRLFFAAGAGQSHHAGALGRRARLATRLPSRLLRRCKEGGGAPPAAPQVPRHGGALLALSETREVKSRGLGTLSGAGGGCVAQGLQGLGEGCRERPEGDERGSS